MYNTDPNIFLVRPHVERGRSMGTVQITSAHPILKEHVMIEQDEYGFFVKKMSRLSEGRKLKPSRKKNGYQRQVCIRLDIEPGYYEIEKDISTEDIVYLSKIE